MHLPTAGELFFQNLVISTRHCNQTTPGSKDCLVTQPYDESTILGLPKMPASVDTPVSIRTLKLSNIEPWQYLNRFYTSGYKWINLADPLNYKGGSANRIQHP